MKTIAQLCEELTQNEELKKAFVLAVQNEKTQEFIELNGCDATEEELRKFFIEKSELSEEELEHATGGGYSYDDLLSMFSPGRTCYPTIKASDIDDPQIRAMIEKILY